MTEKMIHCQLIGATVPGVGVAGDWVDITENLYNYFKASKKVRLKGELLPGEEEEVELIQTTVLMEGGKVKTRKKVKSTVKTRIKPKAGGKKR